MEYKGRMYIFGGLYSLSEHLNDIWYLDVSAYKWVEIHKLTKLADPITVSPISAGKSIKEKAKKSSPTTQIGLYTVTLLRQKNSEKNSPMKRTKSPIGNKSLNKSTASHQTNVNDISIKSTSPFKFKKKKKVLFYLKEKEDDYKVENNSPTSLAMKGSIIHSIIGSPNDICKDMKIKNDKIILRGEYPCERDGHCAAVIGDKMIIFGGDRFQMSFNDLFTFNLT